MGDEYLFTVFKSVVFVEPKDFTDDTRLRESNEILCDHLVCVCVCVCVFLSHRVDTVLTHK